MPEIGRFSNEIFKIISYYKWVFDFLEYGALQEGSLSSTNSVNKFWLGSDNQKEDLYFWMAKQQDNNKKKDTFAKEEILRPKPVNTIPGQGPSRQGIMQDSIKLLDAHLIFEPLLTCLGVMPQQMVNKFQNAGKWKDIF